MTVRNVSCHKPSPKEFETLCFKESETSKLLSPVQLPKKSCVKKKKKNSNQSFHQNQFHMLKWCQVIIVRHCGTAASSSCDQHILRRALQCSFWVLQSHKSPGEPHQDLFPAYSHSTLHQAPHSASFSVRYGEIRSYPTPACAGVGTAPKGLPKSNAEVMWISPLVTNSFNKAWRHLLRCLEQEPAAKTQGCRPLWETLGFTKHVPRAFPWDPIGGLQLSGSALGS